MMQPVTLSQIHGEKCWPSVDKISPCEQACPLHTDVPGYVMALAQGKFPEALAIIRKTNPLPSVCGYVCHHPCETKCNRLLVDEPIAVEWLKRAAVDFGQGQVRPQRGRKKSSAEVAIVGSGPAGLTAAHDLAQAGYGVTVFEALPVAGGMLRVGIPDFALPPEALKQDIDYIESLGVKIMTGTPVNSLDELFNHGFKPVLLATGAHKSAALKIPGAELKNILNALPFLKSVRLEEKVEFKGKVIVIGGGNVAIDAARTALRLGASEVNMTCLESREQMPAHAWEIDAAEREGVKIHAALAPQSFKGADGKVVAVEFRQVEKTWLENGRVNWTLTPGSEIVMPTDTIIIAIGQSQSKPSFADKLKLNERGGIQVDPLTMQTSLKGVFAAGDAVSLPGTVSESMAAGRKAASGIISYLNGRPIKSENEHEAIVIDPKTIPPWFTRKQRVSMLVKNSTGFGDTNKGYTKEQAMAEAQRCLNCWMCANCIFEREQLCFETGSRLLSAERRQEGD
jgi:NADPH-dependent glutamate synthase beta subunit-like oxidoreductase